MKSIGLIKTFSARSGGNIYRNQVASALSAQFDVETVDVQGVSHGKYMKGFSSFWNLFMFSGKKDAWVDDFYSTVWMQRRRTPGKHIALIFHVDFSEFPGISRLVFTLMEKLFFFRRLRKADAIVTISEYWRQFFLSKNYKNVEKVYCGFDMSQFEFNEVEITDFKKKHGLEGKPIIYIGNHQKAKGIIEAYHALKDLDVHLVTSGKKEIELPVVNINGTYKEYLLLLKVSSVAVTMSRFKEGWCMTAHEAMLCKTPVVGSGMGGMQELLEGGKQIICTPDKIKEKVIYLLHNPKIVRTMGEEGYEYAKQFTMEKFTANWINIMQNL